MPALCRDCLATFDSAPRCPVCRSPRILAHPELTSLSIAHMDCDAFYASVEKRDNPALRDQPVIVGGGTRGVVSTCCYIARISGVRSAMPMFQALKLCPNAVVVKPRMSVYVEVSRAIRAMMEALTPAIEPLSLDEAFLDLDRHRPPARRAARRPAGPPGRRGWRTELGITGSVGLSHNKFLAKIASDLDKPRGFSVIGKAETEAISCARNPCASSGAWARPRSRRWQRRASAPLPTFCAGTARDLNARFGATGDRLWHLARGAGQSPGDARREDEVDQSQKPPSTRTPPTPIFSTATCGGWPNGWRTVPRRRIWRAAPSR